MSNTTTVRIEDAANEVGLDTETVSSEEIFTRYAEYDRSTLISFTETEAIYTYLKTQKGTTT